MGKRLLSLLLVLIAVQGDLRAAERPNFLVVVADDMGWSDISPFGGEIRTPVLQKLAEEGLAMSQFYVAPTCAPTRAMLLTGLDNHRAGVGAQMKKTPLHPCFIRTTRVSTCWKCWTIVLRTWAGLDPTLLRDPSGR